jgi:hypothetical protein
LLLYRYYTSDYYATSGSSGRPSKRRLLGGLCNAYTPAFSGRSSISGRTIASLPKKTARGLSLAKIRLRSAGVGVQGGDRAEAVGVFLLAEEEVAGGRGEGVLLELLKEREP